MRFRRAITAAAAVGALAAATGCIPTPPGWATGEGANLGWAEAQAPSRTPIRVGDIPGLADDQAVLGAWNWNAAWEMLVSDAGNPQVSFQETTPLIDGNGNRRQAWVQRFTAGPGGHLTHVTIHYDPHWMVWAWDANFWRHELGHALGYGGDTGCENPYRGVLSYCGFPNQSDQFGESDRLMLRSGGYRAV
jgi:hypothetical protein